MAANGQVQGMHITPTQFRQAAATHVCEVCVQAKLRRAAYKPRDTQCVKVCEVLHSDLCSYETTSLEGGNYILTVQDEATRYVAVQILHTKSGAVDGLKHIIETWENATGNRVRVLYSDRGGEYMSSELSEYLQSKGITQRFSVPHEPRQNGRAERVNQTLTDTVRSMLIEAGFPNQYWALAMVYAVQIRNAAFKKSLGMSPHQAFTGFAPTVRNFLTFGCKVYARIPEDQRKHLDLTCAGIAIAQTLHNWLARWNET
jgi:hypothetical protein